jgi:hypothetical protein
MGNEDQVCADNSTSDEFDWSEDAETSFSEEDVGEHSASCPVPTGNLAITVTDACFDTPIEGVDVQIEGPQSARGMTDAQGHAEFQNINTGAYFVAATKTDYSEDDTSATVSAETTSSASLVMQRNNAIKFIRQDNSAFPATGNDACHMISKYITNVNLPNTATFAGPAGASPDPDTFRVQILGLPAGQSPTIRVEIRRGGSSTYSEVFNMVHGNVGGQSAYRTNKHLRLVSNAPPAPKPAGATYDDEHAGTQTILAKLNDIVRATLVLGGSDKCRTELRVARPPAENGTKAIRTTDIHFVTLTGVSSQPATTVDRMSEDFAQIAIRFNLKSSTTVTSVTNVLSIQGTAGSNGQLTVRVTPQGGSQTAVTSAVTNGQTAEQMASSLATAISGHAGLSATHHRHQNQWLVMVNKGREVTFANINSTTTGVVFTEPPLNFNNDVDLLEGSVLGLNFKDTAAKSITIIAVSDTVLGGSHAAAGGNYLQTNLPGWHNVAILREASCDGNDGNLPTVAGHEMGHVLFDVGNSGHSPTTSNLFYAYVNSNVPETLTATKRLTDTQNTDARTDSGPSTTPGLLQKK